jgi:hypothetical protein
LDPRRARNTERYAGSGWQVPAPDQHVLLTQAPTQSVSLVHGLRVHAVPPSHGEQTKFVGQLVGAQAF